MTIIIGIVFMVICILGSYAMMGGHLDVLWQPFELVIILGTGIGAFIVANPMKVIMDTFKGTMEAFGRGGPGDREYLDTLGLLYSLMREFRARARNEVEVHFESPNESPIFQKYPSILKNTELTTFICDYCRLIVVGNARPHEIEALMDEEIQTIRADWLKCYHAMVGMSDALPALGIIAAVLGVIKAMGALNESPEVLGHHIGAALVGTFAGIFFSYGVFGPLAAKIKAVREKKVRVYVLIKQTLLAFMNGAMPQVAVEYGRKTISAYERPTIDRVEQETLGHGGGDKKAA